MTRSPIMTGAAALAVGLTLPAILLTAPASAEPAGNGPWHTDLQGPFSEIQEDFCDVPGLTVEYEFTDNAQVRDPRILGPDQFPYDWYFDEGYEKFTNVATGESVTLVHEGGSLQDIRLIDNGDGTFTRYVTNKGHSVLYSDDGDVLERQAGVFSYSVVYNYNETPSDPSDDFKVGRPTILKQEGNNYDFCAVVVGAIG
ncbi:hypothetical protein [Humibacillus xanthopallidus]|uniref:Uncharacterized protein n=1 Tax=Humibacillus xanthopallidus TaxID=412689 RepID=A0A543I3A0_9MICO|nr:hypothetical protein [Humibacillus xanthopallidus]TQM65069.1 hypothetical protein FBY41_1452 [Humibacillus xanthopallidus]